MAPRRLSNDVFSAKSPKRGVDGYGFQNLPPHQNSVQSDCRVGKVASDYRGRSDMAKIKISRRAAIVIQSGLPEECLAGVTNSYAWP